MPDPKPGIVAYGAYIPQRRLQRKAVVAANAWFNSALKSQGKGERAMANWDEDAVTMAVAAARDCLTELERRSVTALHLSRPLATSTAMALMISRVGSPSSSDMTAASPRVLI